MQVKSKVAAQQRVDQVRHFQAEVELLAADGVLNLSAEQHDSLQAYHGRLLRELAADFDVDVNRREKQLSLGMKVASFLGALALAASVFFLFYQFWGRFSQLMQVLVLVSAPLIGLGLTMLLAGREKTGYFSKLFGLVTLACFVLNLTMFGQMFNITPSPNAFLVWALLALLIAYAADARLLLAFGILCLAAFLSARTGSWAGCYWLHFGERPENFLPVALLLFAVPLIPHHRFSGFAPIYRVFAMLLFFLPLLILADWGRLSYLALDPSTIEAIYQLAGFACSALAIWFGIRQGQAEVVNSGNVFFTIFLYTKFYDWWWDWLPKYLFFLLIGLSAILVLLVFKRLRAQVSSDRVEVAHEQ